MRETLRHSAIAAVYTALAIIVALALPASALAVDSITAIALGGLVFVFGAVLHEAYARHMSDLATRARLAEIRQVESEILNLLRRQQQEKQTARSVASEVKILQELMERLLSRSGDTELLARVRGGADGHAGGAAGAGAAAASQAGRGGQGAPGRAQGDVTPVSEQNLIEAVRAAVRSDRVEVHLQPIVTLPQRKPLFYEGFTRIRREDGEALKPEEYVPVAEREGIIDSVDNMMLFRAVQLVRETQRKDVALSFVCNISTHTLADEQFMTDFADFIRENPQLAGRLIFEVSQADVNRVANTMSQAFRQLTELGFSLSMDQVTDLDFDPQELKRLGFAYVKVPADVLLNELRTPRMNLDVRDLKTLLDRWQMALIAERIEREDQLRELLDLGLDYGQGYLFGQPKVSRLG